MDPNRNWLVAGTSFGFLVGVDLRFHLPFRTLALPQHAPIERIIMGGDAVDNHTVTAASGPALFQSWNMESGECTKIYRVGAHAQRAGDATPPSMPGAPSPPRDSLYIN